MNICPKVLQIPCCRDYGSPNDKSRDHFQAALRILGFATALGAASVASQTAALTAVGNSQQQLGPGVKNVKKYIDTLGYLVLQAVLLQALAALLRCWHAWPKTRSGELL